MANNHNKQNSMIETTDCLEAVGVFRGWKNFLFIIIVLCLLLLQISFWLVDRGCIKSQERTESTEIEIPASVQPRLMPPLVEEPVTLLSGEQTAQSDSAIQKEVETATKTAVKERPVQSAEAGSQTKKIKSFFGIKIKHISWLIRFCNFVLILAAVMYCLAMFFCLKISLVGRLGGINHICRAFFLSLIMVILLMPWQRVFGNVVLGAIYTPNELLKQCAIETRGFFGIVFHYLRFTGFWLLVLLLLIFSQLRSARWTKAILRRLEIV